MDSELKYFTLLIEKEFYEQQKTLLDTSLSCKEYSELPCSCLTGLTINYWGYIIRNCRKVDLENTFRMQDGEAHILSSVGGRQLFPTVAGEEQESKYVFSDKICRREQVSAEKAYLQEDFFSEYYLLAGYLKQMEQNIRMEEGRIRENEAVFDFLKIFFVGVRTQPMEAESKALLAMSLFFFPNRTMKLILDYLQNGTANESEKKYIWEFLKKYKQLVGKLETGNQERFFLEFSAGFRGLTGIFIGEWLDNVFKTARDAGAKMGKGKADKKRREAFYKEALLAAHNRSREELARRSSRYEKIRDICEKGNRSA